MRPFLTSAGAIAFRVIGLQTERAKIDGEPKTVQAELGLIRYPMTTIGAGDQTSWVGSSWSSRCCSTPLPSCYY
jgi:hypothetical protein